MDFNKSIHSVEWIHYCTRQNGLATYIKYCLCFSYSVFFLPLSHNDWDLFVVSLVLPFCNILQVNSYAIWPFSTGFFCSFSLSLPLYVSFSASLCVCVFLFPLSICVSLCVSSSLPLVPSSILPLFSVLTLEVVFLCNQSPEAMENDITFLQCRSFLRSSRFSPTGQALLSLNSHTAQSQMGAFPLPAPARESLSCFACSWSSISYI